MTLITVSGYPGSGTTTVVGRLRDLLGLPSHNIGEAFREMAAEKGLSLADMHRLATTDRTIDRLLDEKQVDVARKGDVILEGRLAGFLVHRAGLPGTRTWLRAPLPLRASRVAGREGIDLRKAKEEIRVRQEAERTRYIEYYGFDLDDTSIYDLVIDSQVHPPEEIAKQIVNATLDNSG
ncbi:MAG: (d)CMP kinase [Planctomycetota bacterium]|jgi:predicted cytidylate kinase